MFSGASSISNPGTSGAHIVTEAGSALDGGEERDMRAFVRELAREREERGGLTDLLEAWTTKSLLRSMSVRTSGRRAIAGEHVVPGWTARAGDVERAEHDGRILARDAAVKDQSPARMPSFCSARRRSSSSRLNAGT